MSNIKKKKKIKKIIKAFQSPSKETHTEHSRQETLIKVFWKERENKSGNENPMPSKDCGIVRNERISSLILSQNERLDENNFIVETPKSNT